MKSKAIAFLAIFFLVLGFSGSLVTAGSSTVTLNLHKAASISTVNTKGTGGQIFNTTASWSSGVQENSSAVAAAGAWSVYFYLYPTLAGTLTFSGTMTVTTWIKANATVVDPVLTTTLSKIAAGGAATLISTKAATIDLNATYFAKSSAHSTISATVASGFTLQLNVTLSGSASNLTYTVGYDTAATNSRIALVATDPVTVSLSTDFDAYRTDQSPVLTATVTDVFGGYDIAEDHVHVVCTYPVVSYTLAQSSYGDTQYSNTYTYTVIHPAEGTWTPTATTTDNTGNSYTSAYSFRVNAEPGPGNLNPLDVTGSVQWSFGTPEFVGVCIVAAAGLLIWQAKKPRRC